MKRNARDLILATFNLLNLHDAGASIYGRPGWSSSEYEKKIEWTGRVLSELDADVIGFQELWSRTALTDAFRSAGLEDQYDLVTLDGGSGINVAAAVRVGLMSGTPEWIEEFPTNAIFENLREVRDAEEMDSVTIRRFSRPVLKLKIKQSQRRPSPPVVKCMWRI